MDLLQKIDMMVDTTVAGDVAVNNAKGKIDVIGGECPKGTTYDKVKKICVPVSNEAVVKMDLKDAIKKVKKTKKTIELKDTYVGWANSLQRVVTIPKNEASVVGGSYLSGTTINIIGSGQTRTVGRKVNDILDLARKEPVEAEMDDPTQTNIIGRKGLKFDKNSGAYVPELWGKDE